MQCFIIPQFRVQLIAEGVVIAGLSEIGIFPLLSGQRFGQDQGIDLRNDDQDTEMEQVRFRGKIHIIRKGAERVDGGMDEDAGQQAVATIKNRDQQETHCGCKDDLAQVMDQIHTAAVEHVDDMSDAKSYA